MLRFLLASSLLCATCFGAFAQFGPWEMEKSGTTASLRGVHAVGGGVVWASGTNGTVLRTEDSGYMWQSCAMPPDAEKLDFRAVWAWDANTAIVMSSGPGDQSRIYKTTDGCSRWTLLYTNPDKDGFWDAMWFIDRDRGLVLGDPTLADKGLDPLGGPNFSLRYTLDGGTTWGNVFAPRNDHPGQNLQGFEEEAFFAASNSSIMSSDGRLWLATSQGRVLRRPIRDANFRAAGFEGGLANPAENPPIVWKDWQSSITPLKGSSKTAGIFSIAFRDAQHGLVAGGDYAKPRERDGTAAWSQDGGAHWALSSIPPNGYRSAVAWDPDHKLWITVGPNGSDLSRDDGHTWQAIEYAAGDISKGGEWNALSLPWAVGPNGRIAKLNAEALPAPRSPGPGSRIKPPSGIRARHPQ
jgi:photosystem II stability/assembly factor-like uncharacterized protein